MQRVNVAIASPSDVADERDAVAKSSCGGMISTSMRFPNNTDILNALVAFHRDNGNTEAARTYADKLRSLSP